MKDKKNAEDLKKLNAEDFEKLKEEVLKKVAGGANRVGSVGYVPCPRCSEEDPEYMATIYDTSVEGMYVCGCGHCCQWYYLYDGDSILQYATWHEPDGFYW